MIRQAVSTAAPLPTDRQTEVLEAIREHWTEWGFAPSVRDLMDMLNIRSPNGITCHLKALQAKGLVTWQPGLARTLRCTDAAYELVGDVQ
jgi:repressor LexA